MLVLFDFSGMKKTSESFNMKILWVFICLCSLSSCLHISKRIKNLPYQAKKTHILQKLGKPFKIQRKEGKDYWIYKFVIEGKHYTQPVIIDNGLLYKVGKLKPYPLRDF